MYVHVCVSCSGGKGAVWTMQSQCTTSCGACHKFMYPYRKSIPSTAKLPSHHCSLHTDMLLTLHLVCRFTLLILGHSQQPHCSDPLLVCLIQKDFGCGGTNDPPPVEMGREWCPLIPMLGVIASIDTNGVLNSPTPMRDNIGFTDTNARGYH